MEAAKRTQVNKIIFWISYLYLLFYSLIKLVEYLLYFMSSNPIGLCVNTGIHSRYLHISLPLLALCLVSLIPYRYFLWTYKVYIIRIIIAVIALVFFIGISGTVGIFAFYNFCGTELPSGSSFFSVNSLLFYQLPGLAFPISFMTYSKLKCGRYILNSDSFNLYLSLKVGRTLFKKKS